MRIANPDPGDNNIAKMGQTSVKNIGEQNLKPFGRRIRIHISVQPMRIRITARQFNKKITTYHSREKGN